MTIQGAMNELINLLNADDIPIYYKGGIKKVIETIDDYIDGKDDYIKRKTEPQADCEKCKHFREEAEMYTHQCEFYFKECKFEPKDESQTDKHKCRRCVYYDVSSDYYPCVSCVDYSNYTGEIEDESQTERRE